MKNISEMFGSIGLACTVGNEVSRANNDDREKWRAAKVIGLHHPLISRVETSRLPFPFSLSRSPSFLLGSSFASLFTSSYPDANRRIHARITIPARPFI